MENFIAHLKYLHVEQRQKARLVEDRQRKDHGGRFRSDLWLDADRQCRNAERARYFVKRDGEAVDPEIIAALGGGGVLADAEGRKRQFSTGGTKKQRCASNPSTKTATKPGGTRVQESSKTWWCTSRQPGS